MTTKPVERDDAALELWADIQDDPCAIVACSDRWKAVAAKIGCTLHGFNDGRSASFITPDGNVIEVGPKFRTIIASLSTQVVGDTIERPAPQAIDQLVAAAKALADKLNETGPCDLANGVCGVPRFGDELAELCDALAKGTTP